MGSIPTNQNLFFSSCFLKYLFYAKDKVKYEIACYKCLWNGHLIRQMKCSSSKFQIKVKGPKLIVFCHRKGSKFSPPIFNHAHGFHQRLKLSFPIGNGNDSIQFSDNVKILIALIYPLWWIFKRIEHQLTWETISWMHHYVTFPRSMFQNWKIKVLSLASSN